MSDNAASTTRDRRAASEQQASTRGLVIDNLKTGAGFWLAAMLGAGLADPLGMASPIWPAAGVAVVATLRYGYRVLPAIFVAEYLIAALPPTWIYPPGGLPPLAAVGFALANVAQAFVATATVRRLVGWPAALIAGRDVFRFVVAAGPFATAFGASIATAAIAWFVDPSLQDLPFVWWNFWVGGTLGTILFAPLLLIAVGRPRAVWRERGRSMAFPHVVAGLVLFAVLVVTAVVERRQVALEFQRRASSVVDAFAAEIEHNLDVVQSTASFIRALHTPVTEAQFEIFARDRLALHPGLGALSWNPLVAASARADFEREMRESGYEEFVINERGPEGRLVPAGARTDYVVVKYIEPTQVNRGAIGFDIQSNALRRAAIQAARMSRELAATAPVRLVQDDVPAPGQLLLQPVYRGIGDETPLGFVVGVVRPGTVLDAATANVDAPGIDLRLADYADGADRPLVSHCAATADGQCTGAAVPRSADPGAFVRRAVFPIGGREWALTLSPSVGYFAANRPLSAWLAPGAAVVIAIAIVGFLLMVTGNTYVARVRSRELMIRNQELERFTYSVSHDLKSPLITVQGYLDLLAEDIGAGNDEQVASDLDRIDRAAGSMLQTLDGLLALSRAGHLAAPSDEVDVDEIAREAVDLLQGPISATGATVTISPGLPVVTGDRLRLREVLQNLVENALKFSGDELQPHISIDAEEHPDTWQIRVRDNGIGVESGYADRVFELFERLDGQTEGSGIGLSLCRRIVELHGGRIWLESDGIGRGATVSMTLPKSIDPRLADG